MKTFSFTKNTLALAVSAASVMSFNAVALEGESVTLEEVMVTATRRSVSVQDIPFNISAISGDDLEKAGIVDSIDALRTVAGITQVDRGYRNQGMASSIVIRGINVDSGGNGDVPLAAVPTVASYVDDTPLNGNFILKDIERVEVLRGPQGTLYGSGSLAGTVRYIMAKPNAEEFEAKVSAGMGQSEGSDGYNRNADVMINIPLSDNAAFRANIGKIDNDGIVDYTNLYAVDATGDPILRTGDALNDTPVFVSKKDVDTVDIEYARASILVEPTDELSLQLSYQRQEDKTGGRRQVTRGPDNVNGGTFGEYEHGSVMEEPASREVDMTALEVEADLGFATLTSSTSQYNHEGTGISDNGGTYSRYAWWQWYGSSPRPMAQAERFYDDKVFTQEVRLVSNASEGVEWTVGAFYSDQDQNLGQNSYLKGYDEFWTAKCLDSGTSCTPQTEQDFEFRRKQAYEEKAIFGEATFALSDQLNATLGGRYFSNELKVDASVAVPVWGSDSGPVTQSTKDEDFLMKANLSYDISNDMMAYLTASEGYRHGGANAVPITGKYAENPAFFTFSSDKLMNYELGLKGSTDTLTYTASLYYSDWKDPQLNTSTSNWGFFAVVNGEKARTQGLELELNGQLTESLSYNLGYTYADAKLTADVYKPAGNYYAIYPLREDLLANSGDRLPGTSKNVFNVSLSHEMDLSDGMTLSSVVSGYYQSDAINALGSSNVADENYDPAVVTLKGFSLWNLTSTLSTDTWAASLYVKNVFNEDGITGSIPEGVMPSGVSQGYLGSPYRDYLGSPRTMGATLSYKF